MVEGGSGFGRSHGAVADPHQSAGFGCGQLCRGGRQCLRRGDQCGGGLDRQPDEPGPQLQSGRANGPVFSLAVQADGKILVGGGFTTLGGQSRELHWPAECRWHAGLQLQSRCRMVCHSSPGLAGGWEDSGGRRVHHAGRAEPQSHWPAECRWHAGLELQSGCPRWKQTGLFPWPCRRMGRFWWEAISPRWAGRAAPTLAGSMPMARWTPASIREQTGVTGFFPGRAGGWEDSGGRRFTTLGGQSRKNMGRLNADGTLGRELQSGGKRGVGQFPGRAGGWEDSGGRPVHHAGRAEPQSHWPAECRWHVGHGLQSGSRQWVYSLAVQADGKILVGGYFTTLERAEPHEHWPAEQHGPGDAEPDLRQFHGHLDARWQQPGGLADHL